MRQRKPREVEASFIDAPYNGSGMDTMEQAQAEKKAKKQSDETGLETFASYCAMFVVVLFVFTFVFENFEIPSGSMLNTLLIGDHVMVDRITFGSKEHGWSLLEHHRDVKRGDIIVFIKPNETNLTLVKRVVGIPGDRIHLENGVVYLNGKAQNEPQAIKPDDTFPYRDDFPNVPVPDGVGVTETWAVELPQHIQNGDLVVPPGHYFAMGDNRPYSLDSRYWGFVPRENILGRPMFVYWSFETPEDQQYKTGAGDQVSFWLHEATHFFTDTRWSRTLHITR
ncbi:signal peptidase I [Silvibacterium acidisoli]|uniref:signal peptidase I n=1 Tax=Acidobacteriaceae bacterium ZG23-2 TaxID=2883246 RepID=UPI00406C8D0B